MTTIVYQDGVMYSDSRYTIGGNIGAGKTGKIYKTDYALYAISGHCSESFLFKPAFHLMSCPESIEESLVELTTPDAVQSWLVVFKSNPKVVWFIFMNGGVEDSPESYYFSTTLKKGEAVTDGTGADAARGAIMAGATPEQAIKIASKIDACTDDKIQKIAF